LHFKEKRGNMKNGCMLQYI